MYNNIANKSTGLTWAWRLTMILCLQGEGGVEYRQGRPLHSRCSQVLNNNAHKEFSSPKFLLVLRLKPIFCSSWTSMPNFLAMVSHPWAIFRPGAVCVNYVAWGGWLGLVDLHVSVHIYVWIYAYLYIIYICLLTYLVIFYMSFQAVFFKLAQCHGFFAPKTSNKVIKAEQILCFPFGVCHLRANCHIAGVVSDCWQWDQGNVRPWHEAGLPCSVKQVGAGGKHNLRAPKKIKTKLFRC